MARPMSTGSRSSELSEDDLDQRPIFVAAHPRAISTAFERVFMTQRQRLSCLHEPFGDPFYYGPERMSERFENDERTRNDSGFSQTTYQNVFDDIEKASAEGKRVFIKDMSYYLFPPYGKSSSIAPSIAHHVHHKRGVGTSELDEAEPHNPTVIPESLLKKFHFAFLIRHPRYSVPSYFRCTVPPLVEKTGFQEFLPSEAGYSELRRFFDFLLSTQQVGPEVTGKSNGFSGEKYSGSGDPHDSTANGVYNNGPIHAEICVIDADDLLDDPEGIIRQFCESVHLEYDPGMLVWDNEEDQQHATAAFKKWEGWHKDALGSTSLKPRQHKKQNKTEAQEYAEWVERFGDEGARVVKETISSNISDYEYLKQFALVPQN